MKNLEFLKKQIKYTGLGEGFDSALRDKINKGLAEFQINSRDDFGKDVVTTTLNFSKSASSDLYFFNDYKVELKPENSKQLMSRTFWVGRANNITLKEAYNLMNGRSIFKEWSKIEKQGEGENARYVATDEKYSAWKKFNFNETYKNGNFTLDTFGEGYGFDLLKELSALPIKGLDNEVQNSRLVESLQRGNSQSIILSIDGKEGTYFAVANPQFKSVDIYDSDGEKLDIGQHRHKNQEQSKDKTENEDQSEKKKRARSNKKAVA